MKKIILSIALLFNIYSYADEGMWILSLLNKKYDDLKKQGFKLTAEDIYNINQASLKDAIVGLSQSNSPLGFFCSGSIVSNKGLVFTNHHCGYSYVQQHSTLEHNYLADGFWAKSLNDELPNKGLCASILLQIIDITNEILTPDLDTTADLLSRRQIIEANKEGVLSRYEGEPYLASIAEMFEGNQYLLFLYETYYDVRLVGVPPSDIGKFGGDTDNWMWPRHTGDFCIFRIYTAPDGTPAEYSPQNIPLQPKRFLKININGVQKNDYAMIIGFPGSTNRYYTSYAVNKEMEITAPYTVKIRGEKLRILDEQMSQSKQIRLKYASKYSECSNYYKYYIGQMEQIKNNRVIQKKLEQEEKFNQWIKQDTNRIREYGWILPYMQRHYEEYKDYYKLYVFLEEAVFQGSELVYFPITIFPYLNYLGMMPADSIKPIMDELKSTIDNFYKNFDAETDKRLFVQLMSLYNKEFPDEIFQFGFMNQVQKKYKGNLQRYADDLYKKTPFRSKESLLALIEKPTEKNLSKIYNDDFFAILQQAAMWYMFNPIQSDSLDEAERLWVKAQKQMYPDSIFYPDANSTIRLTYGNVMDYYPRDGVRYEYYTTIDGIMEKEDTTNEEFIVPKKLKELFHRKDFGPYAKNNTVPVCFITTNDITGGNSGSGVMDAQGNLIGIAFDGNWEAMSGDIFYEKELQRTICVDVRYVLFIIDKFANAQNIIQELQLVN